MPTQVFPLTVALRTPVTRTLTVPTEVVEFLDGTEQRWRAGDPLNAFSLTFNDVRLTDVTAVLALVDTVKGAYDSTWSFTGPDGVSYPYMALEQDDFTAVMGSKPGRCTFNVKMRQTQKAGDYSAAAARVYPALPNGCYTQRPFTQKTNFLTTRNDLASGPRYAYYEWPNPKGGWVCDYPVITLAELQGRLNFFIAMGGRYKMFSFHDPVSNTDHPHCRFETDAFECRCLGAGQWAVTLPLSEFFV